MGVLFIQCVHGYLLMITTFINHAQALRDGKNEQFRHVVEKRYSDLISRGHIAISYGLSFIPRVVEYYGDSHSSYLDAGCGQCSVVQFLVNVKKHANGVEVSESALSTSPACANLLKRGVVLHSSLMSIQFPDDSFDVVFSSDVLEHIPQQDIPAVILELVRVSKGDIFLSISLRRAGLDPKPPAPAIIHVTVQPREWWDLQFLSAGCVVNHKSLRSVLAGRSITIEPWLFSYRCGNLSSSDQGDKPNLKDSLWSSNKKCSYLMKPRILARRLKGTRYALKS
mmetsp:Transcript_42287/g.80814  ORF Transcript_42287/g.80814 Transcript_42287/m.80814 type:complete len:282 (+) Transcript_42287:637-1482(+)